MGKVGRVSKYFVKKYGLCFIFHVSKLNKKLLYSVQLYSLLHFSDTFCVAW